MAIPKSHRSGGPRTAAGRQAVAGNALRTGAYAAQVVLPVLQLGLPDLFIEHGDPAKLLALQGLDASGIERSIRVRFSPG